MTIAKGGSRKKDTQYQHAMRLFSPAINHYLVAHRFIYINRRSLPEPFTVMEYIVHWMFVFAMELSPGAGQRGI